MKSVGKSRLLFILAISAFVLTIVALRNVVVPEYRTTKPCETGIVALYCLRAEIQSTGEISLEIMNGMGRDVLFSNLSLHNREAGTCPLDIQAINLVNLQDGANVLLMKGNTLQVEFDCHYLESGDSRRMNWTIVGTVSLLEGSRWIPYEMAQTPRILGHVQFDVKSQMQSTLLFIGIVLVFMVVSGVMTIYSAYCLLKNR